MKFELQGSESGVIINVQHQPYLNYQVQVIKALLLLPAQVHQKNDLLFSHNFHACNKRNCLSKRANHIVYFLDNLLKIWFQRKAEGCRE